MQPITIILTDGYSDWEIAPLAGVGRAFFGADIRFTSPSGGPIGSAAGLPIAGTDQFVALESGVVVVCGGPAWEADSSPDITARLRQSFANGCVIAGICGGTVALARAGLLDDVAHTSNGLEYLIGLVPGYRGASKYVVQSSAVSAGNIITAPAPAPATFAAKVLVAAGMQEQAAGQIQDMLSLEHHA